MSPRHCGKRFGSAKIQNRNDEDEDNYDWIKEEEEKWREIAEEYEEEHCDEFDYEYDDEENDEERISLSDAADIWASNGKDEDYTFGYTEDELEEALNSH